MTSRLDDLMNDLRRAPTQSLGDVEAAVWGRIAQVRETRAAAAAFLPVQAGAIVAALGLGIAGGTFAAAAAATPSEISAFSPSAHLAPSTLLDDAG